jgi:signal transduction histidine kinase
VRPGLFDWRYYFWLIPLDVLVVLFLIAPRPFDFEALISWGFLALIAHAFMAVPFAIFRSSEWVIGKLKYEVGAMVIVGIVRGFAILDIGLLMDLPQIEPYLLRPLNSAVAVPTWFVMIHFLVGSRREFIEDYRALYLKLVRGNISRFDPKKAKLSVKEIEQRVESVLEPLRLKIEVLHGNKISPARLAEESLIIQSYVEEKIRPLSHELWQRKEVNVPRLSVYRLTYLTLFRTRLPIGLTIFPSTVYSLVSLVTFMPLGDALWHQGTSTVSLLILHYLYNYFYKKFKNRAVVNSLALFLALFLPVFASRNFDSWLGMAEVPELGEFVGLLWFFFLLLSFGAALAVSKYHEEIMHVLRSQLNDVITEAHPNESDEVSARFAKYLHGEVQSELLSASMLLSQAAKEKNSRIGRRGIEKTAEILRRDHSKYVVGGKLTPEARMQKIIDAWAGIAEIKINLVGSGIIADDSLSSLSDVIEELVSNSVRHGGASEISVNVSSGSNSLAVTFQDNGVRRGKGKPGLGSSLLKSLTTNVKISDSKEGSIISFQMIE